MRLLSFAATVSVLIASGCSKKACHYPSGACPNQSICAFLVGDKTGCILYAEDESLALTGMVAGKRPLWCSQGGRSTAQRTHSYTGDLFAVDIVSTEDDAVNIVSPSDGQAYVFDGCDERETRANATNNSRCGLGYGNHVKVWDGKTVLLFAHLSSVAIKNGPVHRGDVIGAMGCSGAAAHRHLHFSATRLRPQDSHGKVLATPGWTGQIPVRFKLAVREGAESGPKVYWSDELPCADTKDRATLFVW